MVNAVMAGNPEHMPMATLHTPATGGSDPGRQQQATVRGEFRALITPHRSLGAHSFRLVMALVLACSVIASLPFVMLGAWPIVGFFSIDVLALYIAFRLNFSHAAAFEEVVLTSVFLVLRKVSHKGEQTEWHFNPMWTSLLRETDDEFGLLRLRLASRGEVVTVGDALSVAEREAFAAALSAALGSARRGELR